MAQNFAQRLDITPGLKASGRKGMAQGMGVDLTDRCAAQIASDALSIATRFYWFNCIARKKPSVRANISSQFAQQRSKSFWNGDLTP